MEGQRVAIQIKVKFLGIFKGISGREQFPMELKESVSVREVVERLNEFLPPDFRRILIDPELGDPRPNVLILLNGREIGVFEGLETKVMDGDEMVFIPVSHGG